MEQLFLPFCNVNQNNLFVVVEEQRKILLKLSNFTAQMSHSGGIYEDNCGHCNSFVLIEEIKLLQVMTIIYLSWHEYDEIAENLKQYIKKLHFR